MATLTERRQRKRRVTLLDLAEDLGLSTSTVSRAFDKDAVIAPATRDAILKRASELGYAPNPMARSLITKSTGIVGIFVTDITNPFYPEVLTKLTAGLQSIDLKVMLTVADSSENADDQLRLLLSYQPDVVLVLAAVLSSEAIEACRNAGTPVVFFNRRPADARALGVTCDNVGGGILVADHLIDLGHRKLAFVAGRADTSTNIDRWEGFSSRCVERGIPSPRKFDAGSFSYDGGYRAAHVLMNDPQPPEAIFCANDILAIGLMDCLRREYGIAIPGDISVVGFDGISMASWPSHALTTVRQPVEKMCTFTIDVVRKLCQGKALKPRIERIPGELIERETTTRGVKA